MEQLEVLDGVRDSLDVFVPEVFERSAADMVIATATKQWHEERSLQMTASDRRRFTKQAKDQGLGGAIGADAHGRPGVVEQTGAGDLEGDHASGLGDRLQQRRLESLRQGGGVDQGRPPQGPADLVRTDPQRDRKSVV